MAFLRRSLIVALALVGALAVVLALIVWRGEEWARAGIEGVLQDRLVPALRIAGPLKVSLLPHPQVTVTGIELRDAAAERIMLIRELEIAFDTAGLMQGTPALTSLSVRGLDLVLRQSPDGRWNVSEWVRASSGGESGAVPLIGQIAVDDATIHVEGPFSGRLESARVQVGPIAQGADGAFELQANLFVSAPSVLSAQFASTGTVRFDAAGISFKDFRVDGSAESGAWSLGQFGLQLGSAALMHENATVALNDLVLASQLAGPAMSAVVQVTASHIGGSGSAWRAEGLGLGARGERDGLKLDARLKAASLALQGALWTWPGFALTLSGSQAGAPFGLELEGLLSGQIDAEGPSVVPMLALEVERGSAELPHPAGAAAPLRTAFTGAADFDLVQRAAKGALRGRFDQTRFDGKWRLDAAAVRPLSVELALDRLDLGRYLPPARKAGSPTDLTVWRNWPVEADLRIRELRVQGFVSKDARLRLVGEPLVSGVR